MSQQINNLQSDSQRIARNTIYLYGRMLVLMLVGLYTTRVNFRALGIDNYGLYNVVASIIVFFTFINKSLITATRRYITAEIAEGTFESRRNVFSLALMSHGLIAIVVLALSETVGLYLVNNVLNIPQGRMFTANVVYQFTVLTALWQVFQAPYTAVITAYEKMNIYAYLSVVDVLFKLLVAFATYYYPGDKLIAFAFMVFLGGFVNIGLARLYCIKKFPESRFARPNNRALFKEMFTYMGWSLSGQLVDVGTRQGLTMLVNVYFNVAVNAAMGVSNQITNIVNGFVSNFQVAFNPQITKLYVQGKHQELIDLTVKASRYSSFLVLIFLVPICFEASNFLHIWLEDYPQYAVEFCILTLVSIWLDGISAPFWMIMYSDKKLKKYQITASSILSLSFFGAWLFLVVGYPPYYVILAKVITNALMIVARIILVKEKVPSFKAKKWIMELFGKSVIILSVPMGVAYVVKHFHYCNSYVEFFVVSIICCISVGMSVFLFGLTKAERSFVLNKLRVSNS